MLSFKSIDGIEFLYKLVQIDYIYIRKDAYYVCAGTLSIEVNADTYHNVKNHLVALFGNYA